MSEPEDPDKPTVEAVPEEADLPPTRQHATPAEAGAPPPDRLSIEKMMAEETFPDDGPLAARIRKVDHAIGTAEQVGLFAVLSIVVLVAASAALSDKIGHHQFGRWWFTIVRDGVFVLAMIGAVFATYQQRHLAMDLVSRRLSPRGRLVLGLLLKIFTIGVVALLLRSGLHLRGNVGGSADDIIADNTIVTAIPVGAAIIILHTALHLVIDIEYLVRGKLPPERARSGH